MLSILVNNKIKIHCSYTSSVIMTEFIQTILIVFTFIFSGHKIVPVEFTG